MPPPGKLCATPHTSVKGGIVNFAILQQRRQTWIPPHQTPTRVLDSPCHVAFEHQLDYTKRDIDQATGNLQAIIIWSLEAGLPTGVTLIPQRIGTCDPRFDPSCSVCRVAGRGKMHKEQQTMI